MEPAGDFTKIGRVGRVATITIDHPPMNTISTGIAQKIANLVSEYGGDEAVRAILLDLANHKPPFAADGAALMANPSWEAQLDGPRGTARPFSDRILL